MKDFLDYLNEIQKTNKPLFLIICGFLGLFIYPIVSIVAGAFGPRVFAWVILAIIFSTFFTVTFGDDKKDVAENLKQINMTEKIVLLIIFAGLVYFAAAS